jgi:peptide subunit release factor 1 (eRF1)
MYEEVRTAISRRSGDDGGILISAPPDVRTSLSRGLGPELRARMLDGGSPDFSLSDSGRLGLAQEGLRQVRQKRDGALLDQILEDLGPGGRGVVGRQDVLKALSRDAAGALLVSEGMCRTEAHAVEPLVREALRSGADLRVCDGAAGILLSEKGQGFAAQLRFPI